MKFFKQFINAGALALLLVSCNGVPSKIEVVLPFSEIKSYDMEIIRKKLNAKELTQVNSLRTTTIIAFDVKEIKDDYVSGVWKYGNTVLEGEGSDKISADDEKVINIYKGLNIPLTIYKGGKIKLKDFSGLNKQLETLFLKIYGGDTLSPNSDMYRRITSMFQDKGANQDLFLNNYFPEISMLFKEMNSSYENNSLVSIDSIQSPYGPDFLKIFSKIDFSKNEKELEIFKSDSISSVELDKQLNTYMMNAYGEQAKNIPPNQVPRISFRGETVVVLNDDEVLDNIEITKFINNSREEIVYSTKISFVK